MRIQLTLLTMIAASQLGATDCGGVIRDPGFDLWCGTELCTWKIVRGDARRVPTWHERDSGVELLGADAAIAQLSPVNSSDGTCIRFDLVANVSEDVEARLDIDVFGDGTVDLSERMPTSSWKPLSYKIRIEAPYTGVLFALTKRGTGTAVFAQIAAEIETECEGLPVIDPGPAPIGATCTDDAQCASGLCRIVPEPGSWFGVGQRCVGCDPGLGAAACSAGMVCGFASPRSPVFAVPIECVAAAADELGEQCLEGGECASGTCTGNACSTCETDPASGDSIGCAAGEVCGAAWEYGPSVCEPGAGARVTGEPCATDGDCASGSCNGGEHEVCPDGRPCTNDNHCPADEGLTPGACTAVGIQGGSCA